MGRGSTASVFCACGKPLSQRAIQRGCITGRCASCYQHGRRKPRVCIECGKPLARFGAKRCQPCNNRFLATDKEREERRLRAAMEARFQPEVVARHRRELDRQQERRMAWCPVELRDEYRKLARRMPAADARAEILSRLTPFERQLALVRSGKARIVEMPRIPSRSVEQSLIGNASAMMVAA